MNVNEVVEKLELKVEAGRSGLNREVTGGYVGDLLSDVMANAGEGDIWVTLQVHENVIAVALLAGIAAVVITGGREPAEGAAQHADTEGLPVLSTERTTFETVAALGGIGIEGGRLDR